MIRVAYNITEQFTIGGEHPTYLIAQAMERLNNATDGSGNRIPYEFQYNAGSTAPDVRVDAGDCQHPPTRPMPFACTTGIPNPDYMRIHLPMKNSTTATVRPEDYIGRILHEFAHILGMNDNRGCESTPSIIGGSCTTGQRDVVCPNGASTGSNELTQSDVSVIINALADPSSCNGDPDNATEEIVDSGGGGGGGGPECGNGSCESGEDENSCPQDCGSGGGGGGGSCGAGDCGCPATWGCESWCDDHFGPCNCIDNLYSNPDSWWICDELCNELGQYGDGNPDLDCNGENDHWSCNNMFGACVYSSPHPVASLTAVGASSAIQFACGLGVLGLGYQRRRLVEIRG